MTKTPTTPVAMHTRYGLLYVAVIEADRHSYRDTDRGDVTDIRPRVRVATDPTFDADPTHAHHWTIRGRAYAVHNTYYFQDLTHVKYSPGSFGKRWHKESSPHRGGLRNDGGHQVPYGTTTFDQMTAAVVTALDAFADVHPGWTDLSRYLLHRSDAAMASFRAAEARKEADEHEETAAAHADAAHAVGASVPDSLIKMITEES